MKNNTIALLIGVLIVISVASILAGPKQITRFSGVTGHATGDSYVLFNLSSEVSVMVTGAINFGSGKVNESAAYAVLDSSVGDYAFSFNNITSTAGQAPPPTLGSESMVFDSGRNVSVLYGGWWLGPSFFQFRLNETWEFNHSAKTWSRITSADTTPGLGNRSAVGLSYDSSAQKVILFGGDSSSGVLNDTWEYDGINWTELSPSAAPPARQKMCMVFDPLRNVTVLYGGSISGGIGSNPVDDTWEYNYSSNNWTNISTASNPGALSTDSSSCSMVFNSKEGKMILFNGSAIWEYDGTDWSIKSADIEAAGGPSSSYSTSLVGYDGSRNMTLFSAAAFTSRIDGNFWEYDYSENKWFEILDFVFPQIAGGAGSYDTNKNEMLGFFIFGMNDSSEFMSINETWILNYTPSSAVRNGTWFFYSDYLFIENDGTVNVSVNYTTDNDASAFIGGTSPSLMLKGVVYYAGACNNLNTAYAEISSSAEKELCDVLDYSNFNDKIKAAIKLQVPSDVNSGAHNTTITFTGREVS